MRYLFLYLALISSLFSQSIKIANWNVENLFDLKRQGLEYDEYIPNTHNWNKKSFNKKLNNLSEVICDIDADIIALEEIENDNALLALQKRLKRVSCPYPYRYITKDKNTPIHVAILSRIKLKQKRDIHISNYGRYRSILEAVIPTTPPLHIFVNHWRSKKGAESERIRYALALRRRLKRLPKGSEYIILGDFNSDYQEYRVISKKHNDTNGKTGINHILATIYNSKMVRRDTLLKNRDKFIHYNLWLELDATKRWSYNFFGKKEALDSIIIPPTLLDGKNWEYKLNSFRVFRPRYLLKRYDEIKRWEYKRGKHIGRGFSDHLPIYATFVNLSSSSIVDWFKGKKRAQKLPKGSNSSLDEITIDELNKLKRFKGPKLIKGAVVVLKRDRSAIISQSPNSESILIYRVATPLKEGKRYDIEVFGFKHYMGLPEITDIEIAKEGKSVDITPYLGDIEDVFKSGNISKVVTNIEGVYERGKLITKLGKIHLYFKKRRLKPKNGVRLKIKRAQIGYYRGVRELVIWSKKDFEILK